MKRVALLLLLACTYHSAYCWGFFAHRRINYYAVFLLPPEMLVLYKPNSEFLSDHAVDPDKRRYVLKEEAPRHYIDMTTMDLTLMTLFHVNGQMPLQNIHVIHCINMALFHGGCKIMLYRLTLAFKEKDQAKILKYSAEIGHYIAMHMFHYIPAKIITGN